MQIIVEQGYDDFWGRLDYKKQEDLIVVVSDSVEGVKEEMKKALKDLWDVGVNVEDFEILWQDDIK